MSIVFETDTLLDPKSFTTFGINSKPNTQSPIGYFGTGLKYAIAVLARMKIPMSIWIGDKCYQFFAHEIVYRDKAFQQIVYRQKNSFLGKWIPYDLPYTTELGKNWELWQVFRELEANTRDENGTTYFTEANHDTFMPPKTTDKTDKTYIVVDNPEFEAVWHQRDTIFLPEAFSHSDPTVTLVQVINKPSKYLYYRGMRVFELDKRQPSMFTYNIIYPMTLTEDRTLASLWSAMGTIASYYAAYAPADQIDAVFDCPEDKFFEGRLDFDYSYQTPSEQFKEAVHKRRLKQMPFPTRIGHYIKRYLPEAKPKKTYSLLAEFDAILTVESGITAVGRQFFNEKVRPLLEYCEQEDIHVKQSQTDIDDLFNKVEDDVPF